MGGKKSPINRQPSQLRSLSNTHVPEDVQGPPPPYSKEDDQIAPSTGKEGAPPRIPDGRWDLACSIGVHRGLLQLNAKGELTWTQDACAATDGDRAYWRDGFSITLDLSQIKVTNRTYNWTCDASTDAGRLLMLKRDTISLRNLGERLLVFERTILTKDRDRPPPKPRGDAKGCLKIESLSSNIWTITGTDIYQVEGYENDVVIRSPEFLRLWDMAKQKFRWERERSGDGHIWGFTKKYIIIKVGHCHLHERNSGYVYGNFCLPHFTAFIDFNEDNHFGPVIRDRGVDFSIWESTDEIRGTLVLRGNLENLELALIGQKPTWTKYEETVPVCRNSFIYKRLL